MSTTGNRLRRILVSGAVVAGAGLGAAGVASAATSSATTPAASSTAPAGAPASGSSSSTPPGGAPDPATMAHGPGETLLTGSQLSQATAAAASAVPGATVIRAETNSSGDYPYEVHVKKSDGTYATVELNSSFGVVSTVSGFGAGPAGGRPPTGAAPGGNAPAGTSTAPAA